MSRVEKMVRVTNRGCVPGLKIPIPHRAREFYNPQGEEFERDIPEHWASRLIRAGEVKPVAASPAAEPAPKKPALKDKE